MKTLWFVKSGPDKNHLWDNATFNTLKEAKQYASNLRKTALGAERPYIIERAKYAKSEVYGDVVSIKKYASNF